MDISVIKIRVMADDTILPYKGQTIDSVAVYCPYIPLQMTGIIRSTAKWHKSDLTDKNTGWSVYSVDNEIERWIASQPYDMWDIYNLTPDDEKRWTKNSNLYSLSPEVESWFLLRWS